MKILSVIALSALMAAPAVATVGEMPSLADKVEAEYSAPYESEEQARFQLVPFEEQARFQLVPFEEQARFQLVPFEEQV